MTALADNPAKTLVVGLGKSGLSAARHLAARALSVAVTDSREQPPGLQDLRAEYPDIAVFTGGFEAVAFAAAERLVVSPGVPLSEPLIQQAMARGTEVLGDVELFAREVDAPVVAITGSNGKSTVTTLLGEMARAAGVTVAVGGNLGEPALDLLDPGVALYVLELSSFQLETTRSLEPAAAVVLNVSEDHMDRYPDLQTYAATKGRVYGKARRRILNRDDPLVMGLVTARDDDLLVGTGVPGPGEYGLLPDGDGSWLCRGSQRLLHTRELRLAGRHNQFNALAALALGEAIGLELEPMLDALRRFPGLAHRTQFVAERNGVSWYNDSKATNVGACLAALEGFSDDGRPGSIVLIAGGEGKGADFSQLRQVVSEAVRCVILLGRDAGRMEQALSGATRIQRVADLEQAVAMAATVAEPGDRVLLSPACASLDMFRNFEQRGARFMECVRGLGS